MDERDRRRTDELLQAGEHRAPLTPFSRPGWAEAVSMDTDVNRIVATDFFNVALIHWQMRPFAGRAVIQSPEPRCGIEQTLE
jgi:hypothetical protein